MRFIGYIEESLNSAVKYKQVKDEPRMMIFRWEIKGQKYEMVMMSGFNDAHKWDVTFTMSQYKERVGRELDTYEVTGTGNELAVFSTVIKILIDELIKKRKPEMVTFTAEKSEYDVNTGRVKLYKRLVKRYVPDGYEVKIYDSAVGNEVMFVIQEKI